MILAIGINLKLLKMFQMDRMPVWYILVGVAVILVLGQLAVFSPARRIQRAAGGRYPQRLRPRAPSKFRK